MGIETTSYENPNRFLKEASVFLNSKPVHHNTILTLLHTRINDCEDGRYWIAKDGKNVVGVVVQSPLNARVIVSPIVSDVVATIVASISEVEIALPGVAGDAATATCFAGEWAERHSTSVIPFLVLRLYEVNEVQETSSVIGHFRPADLDDRELLIDWAIQYAVDIGMQNSTSDVEELQQRRISSSHIAHNLVSEERLWLWVVDKTPVSMVARQPLLKGLSE